MTDKGRTESREEWEARIRANEPPEVAALLIGMVDDPGVNHRGRRPVFKGVKRKNIQAQHFGAVDATRRFETRPHDLRRFDQ